MVHCSPGLLRLYTSQDNRITTYHAQLKLYGKPLYAINAEDKLSEKGEVMEEVTYYEMEETWDGGTDVGQKTIAITFVRSLWLYRQLFWGIFSADNKNIAGGFQLLQGVPNHVMPQPGQGSAFSALVGSLIVPSIMPITKKKKVVKPH